MPHGIVYPQAVEECERRALVVEGDYAGSLTTMFGRFDNPITRPPAGAIQTNDARVSFQNINLHRFDVAGALAGEWARYDALVLFR